MRAHGRRLQGPGNHGADAHEADHGLCGRATRKEARADLLARQDGPRDQCHVGESCCRVHPCRQPLLPRREFAAAVGRVVVPHFRGFWHAALHPFKGLTAVVVVETQVPAGGAAVELRVAPVRQQRVLLRCNAELGFRAGPSGPSQPGVQDRGTLPATHTLSRACACGSSGWCRRGGRRTPLARGFPGGRLCLEHHERGWQSAGDGGAAGTTRPRGKLHSTGCRRRVRFCVAPSVCSRLHCSPIPSSELQRYADGCRFGQR